LERAGRATEGESIARELMTVLRSFGGGHDDVLIGCELYVARFASMQDRIEEAESIFQSLRPRYEQANSMAQARGRLFYSGQLVRRRQFVEAEQELLTAVELTGDVCTGTHYSHPDDIILGFIALYEAWGKPHKAAEYRRLRAEIASLHANHEGE